MSDVLQRASKALRETHTGANPASGFTRARVLQTLHDRKRRRWSRWALFGPLAALFLGGTAWAGASGKLPEWWAHAEAWVTTMHGPAQTATAEVEPSRPSPQLLPRPAEPVPEPRTEARKPEEPEAAELEPEQELVHTEPSHVAPVRTTWRRPPPVREEPVAAPAAPTEPTAPSSTEPTTEADPDPELRAFRRAHDLHFRAADPRGAIAAYEEYLKAYPRGRFVPEARYNTALNLLKLGRRDRARTILQSFARADHGAYRQAEASELLDALNEAELTPDGR